MKKKKIKLNYFPISDYVEIALGVLKISPRDFYLMTLHEFELALKGYKLVNGIQDKELLSRNDLLNIIGK